MENMTSIIILLVGFIRILTEIHVVSYTSEEVVINLKVSKDQTFVRTKQQFYDNHRVSIIVIPVFKL